MEDKSPFGGLTRIIVRGTQQNGDQVVHLSVTAEFGGGRSAAQMKVSMDTGGGLITWNGVGEVVYYTILENEDRGELTFTYDHYADDRKIELKTIIHFGRHGWVQLPDRSLELNRDDVVSYAIPSDIVKDKLKRKSEREKQHADLEHLYGMPIKDKSPLKVIPGARLKRQRDTSQSHGSMMMPPSAIKRAKDNNNIDDGGGGGGSDGLMDLQTFTKLTEENAALDRDYVKLVLMPKWSELITQCVREIFRSSQRVRELLRKWNEHPPYSRNLVASFIESFLYSPVKFKISDTHVYFFADQALGIPKTWLTVDEHIFIDKLYVARRSLFRGVYETHIASRYTLSEFYLDQVISDALCRRYIVHQFALDLVEVGLRKKKFGIIAALITGVATCYVSNQKDPFLVHLMAATEKRTILTDLKQLGMSVKIDDTPPEYEFYVPPRAPNVGLPRIPTTPFRLVTPK